MVEQFSGNASLIPEQWWNNNSKAKDEWGGTITKLNDDKPNEKQFFHVVFAEL